MSAEHYWVSCSIREYGPAGEERHLIRPGSLVTVCGHSASHAEIWRRDRRKPKCLICERGNR